MPEQKDLNWQTKPNADRPNLAEGYGIDRTKVAGMLPWSKVSEQMTSSRNYWISTTRPDGRPHAMPVWGVWLDETFYFGTNRNSRKGRNLAANPELVVHLESGDDVVIFEGTAKEVTDQAILTQIAKAFAAKYEGFDPNPEAGPPEAVYYTLRPKVAYAWLESDYVASTTRWHF
jgi:nitroimidazol reductase NimA-like FMN-containing flavoprotein (pyridoxamine 5'-phosphate oxidase superfamily)